jgi:hypothetical protein
LFDFAKYTTQSDDTNLTPSTENETTNVLHWYDPEEVLLASAILWRGALGQNHVTNFTTSQTRFFIFVSGRRHFYRHGFRRRRIRHMFRRRGRRGRFRSSFRFRFGRRNLFRHRFKRGNRFL